MSMNITRRKFSKLTVASLATGITPLSEPFASAASSTTLTYGSNQLDWYPAKSGAINAPIIIYVHGGAWALGNRRQIGRKASHFTKSGYNFASLSYTLFPAANVQTQALQIGEAVNFIHTNANRLNADPDRIALMGHSAGSHLASLATLTGAAHPVKALICNDTRAYDLPFLAKIYGGRLPALYISPFKSKKTWSAWSPISYTGLKLQPPTLISWSSGNKRDRISKNFADALEYDGTEVYRFDGSSIYNHISIDRYMGRRRDRLTNSVEAFLADTLNRE